MKKCCVVTYVFGEKYQSFVPMYIYFINREYPEYDIYIFSNEDIKKRYVEQLRDLKAFNYELMKLNPRDMGYSKLALSNVDVMRSLRWILLEKRFQEYEAIYMGDIDILICHDEMPLFESHMKHAEFLGLPYSNCVRIRRETNSLRRLRENWRLYGLENMLKTMMFPVKEWYRLTGLHFMKVADCFPAIESVRDELIEEINLAVCNKSSLWTICNINDESILYELIKKSGLGLPPKVNFSLVSGIAPIENKNPLTIPYRPHHGLHLALWRIKKYDEEIMNCKTYLQYYDDFKKKISSDEQVLNIINGSDDFAYVLIRKMIKYYDSKK